MALTEIENGMLTDGILTASKLNTTGTASSTTVLKGDFSWGAGASSSGKWNTADSAPGTPVAGDVWYTGGIIYIAVDTDNTTGAWSTGGNLNTARFSAMGGGTQNAGLTAGGQSEMASTEEYNGNVWTTVNNIAGGGRSWVPGNGTQTSAWLGGGGPAPGYDTSETYDGTCWSAANDMLATHYVSSGSGTATAGLIVSGRVGGTQFSPSCEEFDGTSWTAAGSVSTGRNESSSTGPQSTTLCCGGENSSSGGYLQSSEEYNGTSWSAGGTNGSTGRKSAGIAGTTSAAIYAGGGHDPGGLALADQYDGTTWSVIPPLFEAISSKPVGAGSSTAGLLSGGYGSAALANTEEWNYVGAFNAKMVGYT